MPRIITAPLVCEADDGSRNSADQGQHAAAAQITDTANGDPNDHDLPAPAPVPHSDTTNHQSDHSTRRGTVRRPVTRSTVRRRTSSRRSSNKPVAIIEILTDSDE